MPDVTVMRDVLRNGFDMTDLPWVPWTEPGRVGVEFVVLWGPDAAEGRTPPRCCCASRPARTATSTNTSATS